MTGAWATEQGVLTTGDLQFEDISLLPKKVGVIGEYSKYMLLQANPSIEQLFRRDMSESLARTVDSAAIHGASGGGPNGVTSTVTATAQSGTSTDGKKPVLADYYKLMNVLDGKNIPMTSRAWLINPATKYSAAQQVKFSSAGSSTIYDMGMLVNERTVVSNLVKSDGTKGSGTALSTAIYGNWSDLIIGSWSELEILVNPYAAVPYSKGNVQIRAMMVCDVVLRRNESFAFYSDVKTS